MFTIYYSSQGEECIMGMKRVFQKLKANVRCVKARDQYNSQMSESCPCTEADFEWWVPCSAATLFTSLNPKHNILPVPWGGLCSKLMHNMRNVWRVPCCILFLLSWNQPNNFGPSNIKKKKKWKKLLKRFYTIMLHYLAIQSVLG